jgi:hypothetical protein
MFHAMKQFIPRWIQRRLEKALSVMPVVVVTGARQSGKSTLVRHIDPRRRYFSLDDLDVLDQARRDPDSLLRKPPMTLDEVQRAPELLLAIKRRVDAERIPGAYLLTGSAQFGLMRNVSDSLAGRAIYLDLGPFCPLEWEGVAHGESLLGELFREEQNPDSRWMSQNGHGDWMDWLLSGGFAPALDIPEADGRAIWFSGYVQTYLERDLRELSEVAGLPDFQRLMRIAAQRTARLLNQAEIARDAGLAHATCHRYLNLLEIGCQIERVRPYTSNPTAALVKSPKLFWSDSGLAAWLAGIHDRSGLIQRADLGFWLEQAIAQTILAWQRIDPVRRRVSYWRTRGGDEVDFVLEEDQNCLGIEIKAGSRIGLNDIRGLRRFVEAGRARGISVRGVVLYGGSEARPLGDNLSALPYAALFPAPSKGKRVDTAGNPAEFH